MKASGNQKKIHNDLLDQKILLLKMVPLFNTLKKKELKVVASYSQFYSYSSGEYIFKTGYTRDELYVINVGEVIITQNDDEQKEREIARFVAGEAFGELNLFDENPLTVNARISRMSEVLIFPQREICFEDILSSHPAIFANILYKLMTIIATRIRTVNKLLSEKTPWMQELRQQLYIDKLTGLNNRIYLEEEIINDIPKMGNSSGFFMVKPDNFKEINDNFGHEVGDWVLIQIAITVRDTVGSHGIVMRYRGDEFAVLIPGADSEKSICQAQNVLNAVKNISIEKDPNFIIKASIGLSLYPADHTDCKQLYKITFDKMFKARNLGGDKIVCE